MRQFAIFIFQFPFSISAVKPFSYLVSQRRAAVASGSGSFLRDLHADAGADARGSGLDHGARVFDVLHAARSFDTELRTNHAPHQGDVGNGSSALRKSGGGLNKIGSGSLRSLT